jgi:hypothetical protein
MLYLGLASITSPFGRGIYRFGRGAVGRVDVDAEEDLEIGLNNCMRGILERKRESGYLSRVKAPRAPSFDRSSTQRPPETSQPPHNSG